MSESKKDNSEENVMEDEQVSDISMSDVSELSQHSCLELDKELINQYWMGLFIYWYHLLLYVV